MGNTSSMLTQYDIEEVQEHCNNLFTQQEIVSLYKRFCQLDRSAKGFISSDEFLSVPEFAMNPLSQRLLKMVDCLNFKEFVAFLSAFSTKASIQQKIECWYSQHTIIFKVYDIDGNGKVSFKEILSVLRDLTGSYMSENQREQVLSDVLEEAGYTTESSLLLNDFIKVYHSVVSKNTNFNILQYPTGRMIQGKTNYRVLTVNNCESCTQQSIILDCPGFNTVETIDPRIIYKG
ncbi:hypothetical protein IFM89_033184 [Coptis chinensis]|uniref:EF-hand domain-containing protein n=1 Tax=Coptis chinensis TaxID=261450 RepID=A0A835M7Y5_9MAGN|nr:hypothetical protein IFM89_033184 [Coptis chinensis]